MIRFIAGCIVGALGGLYFLGIVFSSTRETSTGGRTSVSFVWNADSPAT